MKIIPAIDLQGGRCVRLFQGNFDKQTEYSKDPVAVARRFDSLGLANLHVVDLDGARSGRQDNESVVRRIVAETGFAVQLGGGIRDASTVSAWFDAGVKRCVIGSAAVTDPDMVRDWLDTFGSEQLVLALDVRVGADNVPALATHGWTRDSQMSLWDALDDYGAAGLRHLLCTDIQRDGALSGPNFDLYRDIVARYPDIELQASGGVRDIADLDRVRETGATGAITGRALLDGRISAEEIESFLRAA